MDSNQQNPILTFNGKKYEINSLPDKAKELLKAAQVSDAQIKMKEDNLKLLTVAKQTIANQLKEELDSISSLE